MCPLNCLHVKVEVELLWMWRVQPARRDVVVDGLERQHLPGGRVKSRPAIADGPPRIRLVDGAAKQGAVERRELSRIGSIQHDAFQGRQRRSLAPSWSQSCRLQSLAPAAADADGNT
jgi:hypothetical protein